MSYAPVPRNEEQVIAEREEESIEWGECPQPYKCPYCGHKGISVHDYVNTCTTYVISFILFLFLGILAFIVLPIIWSVIQTSEHRCSSCLNVLNKSRRFQLPDIRESIVTIRCGSCAMVMSRTYVIAAMALISLVGVGVIFRRFVSSWADSIIHGPSVDDTWIEFVGMCGVRSALGNPLNARSMFDKHFFGNTVHWSGTVLQVYSSYFRKSISIRMNPAQRPPGFPDLELLFTPEIEPQIAEVMAGSHVSFNATLTNLGLRRQPTMGYLWGITSDSKPDIRIIEDYDLNIALPIPWDNTNEHLKLGNNYQPNDEANNHQSDPQSASQTELTQKHVENVPDATEKIEQISHVDTTP